MNSADLVMGRIRRARPLAYLIAKDGTKRAAGSVLSAAGFSPVIFPLEAVERYELPPPDASCWLADCVGMTEPEVLQVVDWIEAFALNRSLVFHCERRQLDLLGPLFGTGATLVCESESIPLESAIRRTFRAALPQLGHMRPAPLFPTPTLTEPESSDSPEDSPFWLDILSDLLTHLAVAREANGSEADSIAALLGQAIDALLSVPDKESLQFSIVKLESRAEVAHAELALLRSELAARPRFLKVQ